METIPKAMNCANAFNGIKTEVDENIETERPSSHSISNKLKQRLTVGIECINQSQLSWQSLEPVVASSHYSSCHSNGHIECISSAEQVITTELRLQKAQSLYKLSPLAATLLEIEVALADQLMTLGYGDKVSHVYNPVDYAFLPHFEYYKRYCHSSAEVIMVGMNPGPFGMAQSGVPFGDVRSVVDWMGIKECVGSPTKLHHKRPILGFECKRSEVSGSRLWGYLKQRFGEPYNFFKRCFVYNHCPLVFMGPSGRNITPAQMPAAVQKKLNELCDQAMLDSLQCFPNCKTLLGVGRFAEDRIKSICSKHSLPYSVDYLMHPSPRNPTANRQWTSLADQSLQRVGLVKNTVSEGYSGASAGSGDMKCSTETVKRQLF